MSLALHGPQRFETVYSGLTGSRPDALANHASNNTKGAWTEFDAATAFQVGSFIWRHMATAGGSYDHLIDLAIGAGGSEVTVLSNILASAGVSFTIQSRLIFPMAIQQGARIAMRKQSSTAAANIFQELLLSSPSPRTPSFTWSETYGATTADSGGTSIDSGGSANTKGSWTQLTASTTRTIRKLFFCLGNQANGDRTTSDWLFDIGVGAGGSEVAIVSNYHYFLSTATDVALDSVFELDVDIPAGSRLSVRSQSAITDATDRLLDVVLIGVG